MSNNMHSPGGPAKNRRLLLVSIAAAMIVAATGYAVIKHSFDRILQDGTLNRLVGRKTAVILEADAGYLPLHWQAMSVRSDGLLVRGKPPRSLTEMQVSDVRASCSLKDLWKRKWTIERVEASQLQAAFGQAAARQLRSILPKEPPLEAQIDTNSPLKLEILEAITRRTTIAWGESDGAVGMLRDVEARFSPSDRDLDCFARNGTFVQTGWPELRVQDIRLHYSQPRLAVHSAVFSLGRPDNIVCVGQLDFGNNSGMDLQFRAQQLPAEPFLTGFWKGKLEGIFDGECRLQKRFQPNGMIAAMGEVHFTNATVHDVPTLKQVAAITRHAQFERPQLHLMKAHYSWSGRRLDVAGVEVESKDLFRIEGDFSIENQTVEGRFRIGVVPDVAESLPGAREKVFTESRGAYLWTSMQLSGPLSHPREDLKQRLVAAARDYFAKGFLSSVFKPGKEVIESLNALYKPAEH